MSQADALYVYMIRSQLLGPSAVCSTIIIGITVVSSYWYPKQRKFPNIVLVWSWYY